MLYLVCQFAFHRLRSIRLAGHPRVPHCKGHTAGFLRSMSFVHMLCRRQTLNGNKNRIDCDLQSKRKKPP